MSEDNAPAVGQADQVEVQLRVERMYVKDLSFESPGAPSIFGAQFQPNFQVDINSTVNSLGDDRHEVVLAITVTAQREENRVAFIAEVHQAGIFEIKGVEGGSLRQVLGIACPNMLFPYVREALDGLIVKGGFPPLQLAPVNFETLYVQAAAAQQNKAQAESDEHPPADDPVTH